MQYLVDNVHWVISKKYNSWIGLDGPVCPNSTMTLQLVDSYSTLVDDSGKHLTILWLHQAFYCVSLEQSLTTYDPFEYNGVKVYSHAKVFDITAINPKAAKPFKINLDGMAVQKLF